MTKRARVVIGANWGDEGKGLLCDFYAAQAPTSVVRFNGGANAGHTVVTPNGKRHVFSHFSSGTFVGANTVLARHFIVNPVLFHKEWRELLALGIGHADVQVDPRCMVTTPIDMLLNQVAEDSRGADRHGSVGVGINETVERNSTIPLVVRDLFYEDALKDILDTIRYEWAPVRAKTLGCADLFAERAAALDLNGIMLRWRADCSTFCNRISVRRDSWALGDSGSGAIVFEGAQGLGIDQSVHPVHSTRSNTGLVNVAELAEELRLALDVTYTSRAYLTRHGAGPLEGELSAPPFPNIVDETNKPHPYQGTMRFAHLDVASMWARIESDYLSVTNTCSVPINIAGLVVTCMDQVPEHMYWCHAGEIRRGTRREFLQAARAKFASWGPTRETIFPVEHDRLRRSA